MHPIDRHDAEKKLELQSLYQLRTFFVLVRDGTHLEVRKIKANTVFGALAQIAEIGTLVPTTNPLLPMVNAFPTLSLEVLDLELP